MLGLILGALAVGNAIYKGISGNQTKQRNKGYIEGNYQMAKQSLQKRQSDIRQSTNEQLAARGLAQGGLSPIARAMAANSGTYPDRPGVISQNDRVPPGGLGGTPHTLGEQQQSDNDEQFRLEQVDVEQQREKAERENKADYIDTLVNAGTSGILGAMQGVNAGKELASINAPPAAASPIKATMTGIDDPANHWGGILSHDPLNGLGSSWNRNSTVSGAGLTNDQFHA
jgi:hypothetical protein